MAKTAFTALKYPTTTTTANGAGSSGSWANPANIFLDDGSNATASFLAPPNYTFELNGAGFGHNIPSNAIIDGITLEYEVISANRWSEANGTVRLKKAGTNVGVNKAGAGLASSGVWSYGGASDLWGTTWTPAEINHALFGFGFDATYTSSGNDFNIAIDFFRITIHWHYSTDVSPTDVPKRYIYKAFNKGVYLGNLPKVTSKFGYAYDINSIGSSINIECGVSADVSKLPGDRLVTEAGDPIITEAGDYIYTEGQSPIIGAGNSVDPYLVQNGNRIEVWEYSYYYPNGKLMFKGQVNRVEAGFGDPSDNKIRLMVISDGLDLANYIARGAPFNYTADVTQTTENTNIVITQDSKGAGWNRAGQTWLVGAGVTKLGSIKLLFRDNADVTVTVYDGLTGSALASVTQGVYTGGAAWIVEFAFSTLIPVTPGNTYFFTVSVGAGQSIRLYYSSTSVYANGVMYTSSFAGGSGGGAYIAGTGDLYFIASAGLPTTTATYTSKDPSTQMLKPIIDDYILRGGLINYSASSVDTTALSLTATFNTETVYDALKKVLALAPSGYYFYIDLATDVLYFKNTLTTPSYKLIKGRHLNKLNLILSIENVKNNLLFSGAETAGVNLYKEYADQTSKTNFGIRLERKSDNRVSVNATADAIGNSFIAENKDEYQETTVTVLAKTMDITEFRPGQTVGIRGFNYFVDQLTLQIVRVEYLSDSVNLTLGNLPLRFTDEYEKIMRGLVAQQTVANPSAPS